MCYKKLPCGLEVPMGQRMADIGVICGFATEKSAVSKKLHNGTRMRTPEGAKQAKNESEMLISQPFYRALRDWNNAVLSPPFRLPDIIEPGRPPCEAR